MKTFPNSFFLRDVKNLQMAIIADFYWCITTFHELLQTLNIDGFIELSLQPYGENTLVASSSNSIGGGVDAYTD